MGKKLNNNQKLLINPRLKKKEIKTAAKAPWEALEREKIWERCTMVRDNLAVLECHGQSFEDSWLSHLVPMALDTQETQSRDKTIYINFCN